MTVITDELKRVVIPSARPGDRFEVQETAEGAVVLTPLAEEGRNGGIQLIQKNGYTVARGPRVITQEEVRKLLDEFP